MTNEFDNIGSEAYNQYKGLPLLAYTCISHLLDVNETIFKLLYYSTPDAWNESDLSDATKRGMIYKGGESMEDYRIFQDSGQSDAWTKQTTALCIYPCDIDPENRSVGTVSICFEVYSHYLINHLSNYTTRTETIIQQLIKEFNGWSGLGEVGKLEFNRRMGGIPQRMNEKGVAPYKGKYIILSTKSGVGIQGTGV
jgi:hypothetical protein